MLTKSQRNQAGLTALTEKELRRICDDEDYVGGLTYEGVSGTAVKVTFHHRGDYWSWSVRDRETGETVATGRTPAFEDVEAACRAWCVLYPTDLRRTSAIYVPEDPRTRQDVVL